MFNGATATDAVVKAVGMTTEPISRALARDILFNEDMLRFKVCSALLECGIDADRLTLEYPHPNLIGNKKVDAVILNEDLVPEVAIEFKYHRKPPNAVIDYGTNAGQLVGDFTRLRDFAGVKRYAVYLTEARMLNHFSNPSNHLSWLLDDCQELTIPNDEIRKKETKAFLAKAGCFSPRFRLRMCERWDAGGGHALIVWQVCPAQG